MVVHVGGLAIKSTTIGASEALLNGAVKPHDHVESTGNESHRRLFLGVGLSEQFG